MDTELTRTSTRDQKVFFGEKEFTNLIRVLIRAYRYRNNNQTPKAIVMPDVKDVDGVKVEFPKTKSETVEE